MTDTTRPIARRESAVVAKRSAVAFGTAVVVCCALAGCSADAAPGASAPPTASAPASSAPPAGPEESDAILFTVAASARAVDGTTLELLLTGHEPLESTDSDASALVDDFLTLCTDSGGLSTSEAGTTVSEDTLARFGSSLMRVDYASTPEGETLLAPVEVIIGIDNLARVGAGTGLQALQTTDTCLNRYQLTESGSGSFVANYESGTSEADLEQWTLGSYGFVVAVDSGATLESCEVTVTPLARRTLTGVPGWEDGAVGTGISCGTGYLG